MSAVGRSHMTSHLRQLRETLRANRTGVWPLLFVANVVGEALLGGEALLATKQCYKYAISNQIKARNE